MSILGLTIDYGALILLSTSAVVDLVQDLTHSWTSTRKTIFAIIVMWRDAIRIKCAFNALV